MIPLTRSSTPIGKPGPSGHGDRKQWGRHLLSLVLPACLAVLSGCAIFGTPDPGVPPLRVGITPNYPPIVFKHKGVLTGLEVDLARRLGSELGRGVVFVELEWEKQVGGLIGGEVDIIMSGMSITRPRQVRIQFAESYVKAGQIALVEADRVESYTDEESILKHAGRIGVIPGTTGDTFVTRKCPDATKVLLEKAGNAPFYFQGRRIDMFIHDAYSIAWLVSENEAELGGVWIPLTEEELAWGVRRGDKALLDASNQALSKWKQDGSLDSMLDRWIPYRKKVGW